MPYKYIGRTTDYKGKTLWEILGNLQNFGVGRMVIRNRMQRYPEPCYMRILKVAALPHEEPSKIQLCSRQQSKEVRLVAALVEHHFRGMQRIQQIDFTSYKTDYQLIPKDREAEFTREITPPKMKILPRTTDYPPLMELLILRQKKYAGENVTEKPKLKLFYSEKNQGFRNDRVAEEGETPNVVIDNGIGHTNSPRLYANIK